MGSLVTLSPVRTAETQDTPNELCDLAEGVTGQNIKGLSWLHFCL